jgi:colanic acid biosynthesis glycosyl transferase WcaI
MRLLLFSINYAPEPTSTGKYTGELGSWLAGRGHTVDAITAPPYYPQWEIPEEYRKRGYLREDIDGVRVYRSPLFVPAAGKVGARNRILHESSFNASSSLLWLPSFLSRKRYDAVIAVCPPIQIGIYPWLYSRARGVPFVLHVQDLQVDVALRLGMLGEGKASRLLHGLENHILGSATRVSTITEAMRRRVVEKGVKEERTWLFPNWADTDFVRPLPQKESVRRELGARPGDALVLYAGNMGEKQGLDLVLEAAERLRSKPGIKFALVGSGAARERLAKSAEQKRLRNVRFLPVQPLERLPSILSAGDLHLVVQRREAADLVMPSKLTNILSAGRPSIATADPGTTLHEVLNDHGCGITTPPGDAEELTSGIFRLACDPTERARMGLNARNYAECNLDKDKALIRFESKLQRLAEVC